MSRVKVRVASNLGPKLADDPAVKAGLQRKAEAVAAETRRRTRVGATGEAKRSIRVESVTEGGRVRTYVVAGGRGAWWFVFQEFGGTGFRPPPAPLRSAAETVGGHTG